MVKKKRQRRRPAGPPEIPVSVFLTVGWTLSVLTTVACSATSLLVWLVAKDRAGDDAALTFARLMHFSSVVTGLVSLLLLPIVLKVRREPPPLGFVLFAMVAAVMPILAAFF